MSVGASVVMNVKSGRSGTGHGTLRHVPGGGGDPYSAGGGSPNSPHAAAIIIGMSFMIAAGFILTFIGYVSKDYSKGDEGDGYRIAGPVLIGVGFVGVVGGCYYGKSIKYY